MRRTILPALFLMFAIGCATVHPDVAGHPGRINHIVIIWLKNPKDQQAKQRIIELSRSFQTVPGMVSVSAGRMNLSTPRPELDTSYDIAVVMTFKNSDDLESYLVSPRHKTAVEKVLKPLVRKQVVYDFAE
jgi:Stress responsive A/B Barrel Domain